MWNIFNNDMPNIISHANVSMNVDDYQGFESTFVAPESDTLFCACAV